jgi:hypothetical protein
MPQVLLVGRLPPDLWENVTAVQTGTYSAAVGDLVVYDSTLGAVTVLLPPINAGNKGRRIGMTSPDAFNANGVNTTPAGTDTVVGIPAGAGPGFTGPAFSVSFTSDGVSNWLLDTFGSF